MNRTFGGIAAALVLSTSIVTSASASLPTPPANVGSITGAAWDAGKNRLWLAGDQAQSGTIVGVSEGDQEVSITFHADLTSVQGLAVANGALYVGDIGDEAGEREFISVYRFADTGPSSGKKFFAYDLAYPDGAKLHATALMVARDGTFYVVTDGEEPGLFVAEAPSRTDVNIMQRVGDAPKGVTDAVMVDNLTAALYSGEGITLVDTLTGEQVGAEALPEESTAAAVALLDESTLLAVGGEGLKEMPLPAIVETPEASAAASEEAVEDEVEEVVEEVAAPTNSGTILALAIAGLVSVAAAVATYLIKK